MRIPPARALVRVAASVVAIGVAFVVGCDPRACLATSPVFSGLRPELVDQCCQCLAKNGTRHPGAACAETFIAADGGLAILADAGPSPRGGLSFIPADALDPGDNKDGRIGDDEVPCLCEDDFDQCRAALSSGLEIVVTGSCVSQGGDPFTVVPCESDCKGVINFGPLSTTVPTP